MECAALDAQAQHIHAESFRLTLVQNASDAIMRRKHQSRLPPEYDARNLFNTPGAGTSDPPMVNRAVETPTTGALVQPRAVDPPCLNFTPPQHVPTPPGHYSNPLDNMIAAATRLAALPIEGECPAAMRYGGPESFFRHQWLNRRLIRTTVNKFIQPLVQAGVIAGILTRQ